MAREFIEGWDLLQILGEGTFGEVKLLVNRATGEACAMKEIDLAPHNGDPATRDAVLKEICVHKLLKYVTSIQDSFLRYSVCFDSTALKKRISTTVHE